MVNKYNLKNNKRGWIRLLEAFVAIVLLTSVLLVVSNINSPPRTNSQQGISLIQTGILRDIQLNDTLREDVLSASISNPIEWEDFDSSGLSEVRDRIEFLSPKDFDCSAKVCGINNPCILGISGKEVYAKSAFISADLNIYSPRQLKIFCTK